MGQGSKFNAMEIVDKFLRYLDQFPNSIYSPDYYAFTTPIIKKVIENNKEKIAKMLEIIFFQNNLNLKKESWNEADIELFYALALLYINDVKVENCIDKILISYEGQGNHFLKFIVTDSDEVVREDAKGVSKVHIEGIFEKVLNYMKFMPPSYLLDYVYAKFEEKWGQENYRTGGDGERNQRHPNI